MQSRIRIMCVDDHRVVRKGLAAMIAEHPDMTVVAEASTGEEAVVRFRLHRPDVTLMDLQLPGMSGVDAIRAIRAENPNARIVVVTMYDGDEDIYQAMHAGAVTYLTKEALADDLVRVLQEVHAGQRPMPPKIAKALASRSAQPTLSSREIAVLGLVADGMRNKEIAAELGISVETTRVHVKAILAKLGVHDRTSAVRVALARGVIHPKKH